MPPLRFTPYGPPLAPLCLLLLFLLLAAPAPGGMPPGKAAAGDPVEERWELVTDIYIGIDTRALTPEEKDACGEALLPGTGLLITQVAPGSPAEEGGLRAGDVIMTMSAVTINSPAALLMTIRHARPGIPLFFCVLREGREIMFRAVPTQRPKPVVIGYLTPARLNAGNLEQIRPLQLRAARNLTEERPPLAAIQADMKRISELLSSSYARGNLRMAFAAPGCRITITRYKTHISVTMEEQGVETGCELHHEGDALPPPMRQGLRHLLEPAPPPKNCSPPPA